MNNRKLSKVLTLLEESKKVDIDLNEIEFDYDNIKSEILGIYEGDASISEQEVIDILFNTIKMDLGLIEEDVEPDTELLDVEIVFEQLIEYMKEDESFNSTELEVEAIKEELEVMINQNPEDSKETVAWVMKDIIKQEIVF